MKFAAFVRFCVNLGIETLFEFLRHRKMKKLFLFSLVLCFMFLGFGCTQSVLYDDLSPEKMEVMVVEDDKPLDQTGPTHSPPSDDDRQGGGLWEDVDWPDGGDDDSAYNPIVN